MAHGYFDIDLEIVSETVQTSLAELERQLQAARSEIRTSRRLIVKGAAEDLRVVSDQIAASQWLDRSRGRPLRR
jgi:hypothetical protein